MSAIGIIGGTSLSSIEPWVATDSKIVETPYGKPSAPLSVGQWNNERVVFLPRHGGDHSVPPHKINYRANIRALKDSGVDRIIAIAAVGGIAGNTPPGSLAIPNQIVDYTYGREHTYFDGCGEALDHVDFTEPYSETLRERLLAAARKAGIEVITEGTYGVTQGPRLETAAEIDRLERDGCTLVGMTGMPEAGLARELKLEYACCAMVVNWAAGRSSETITLEVIREYVHKGQKKLAEVFKAFFE